MLCVGLMSEVTSRRPAAPVAYPKDRTRPDLADHAYFYFSHVGRFRRTNHLFFETDSLSTFTIIHYQLYLGATDEQRTKDLETKLAHLQRLLNAMQTKLRGVQSKLDLAIADREDLRKLIEENTRDSTEPSQEA